MRVMLTSVRVWSSTNSIRKAIVSDTLLFSSYLYSSIPDWMKKAEKCSNSWCVAHVRNNCDDYCKGHKLEIPENRTETKDESVARSLLIHMKDTPAKEKDLVEAFCRDINSFNLAFKVSTPYS